MAENRPRTKRTAEKQPLKPRPKRKAGKAQSRHQGGIEKQHAGDKSPLLSRLLPLKALIFAHPAIFEAAMRVENHLDTRGDFARRSIWHDPNSSSYRTEITPEGFTTFHLEWQQTWPKPKLKLGFSEETTSDGVKIRHYEYQEVGPEPDCELAEWLPVEVSSEHQETWDARPNTWLASYAVFADLVRSGQLAIWARWNSRSAPLERVAPDLWPKQPADECIDFKSACLTFPDGEKLLTIQIEVAQEASAIAASEGTSESAAARPGPATHARPRGRPPNSDLPLIIDHGLKLLRERGNFAANIEGWKTRADLERALLQFVEDHEIQRSERRIADDAEYIVQKYQQDG